MSKLYSGGPDLRLKQEWLLGVGGVRALRALGIEPAAWHSNEGHAAFMLTERLRECTAKGVNYADAVAQVRANSIFTTHTPVAAGHDMFSTAEITACAGTLWDGSAMTREQFLDIGHHPSFDRGTFHMTAAAIRLSRHVNAVSRVHGVVTRHIWAPLWPQRREQDVPIGHVTNGVHLATWMAQPIMNLLDEHLGADWGRNAHDPELWSRVMQLDDARLWQTHQRLKHTLLSLLREEVRRAFAQRSRDANQLFGSGVVLAHDALTIGFARRFATYKRATLLFEDVERLLERILTSQNRPVQIVFAGKAHPADTPGKQVLQQVYQATRDPRFEGRASRLWRTTLTCISRTCSCRAWISGWNDQAANGGVRHGRGMKAALNGVPRSSSAVDGWWEEGFDGSNGWSIKAPAGLVDDVEADAAAAAQLYDLLEREIVPTYYDVDAEGIPRRWINVMKNAMRVGGAHFTAARMMTEYVSGSYVPAMLGDPAPDAPPTA